MGGFADPSLGEVEADQLGDVMRQLQLRRARPVAVGQRLWRPRGAGRDQRAELVGQLRERRSEVGTAGARLVLIKQRVVGFVSVADRVRLATLESDHSAQRPAQCTPVAAITRAVPHRQRLRGGFADLAYQRLRDALGPLAPVGEQHGLATGSRVDVGSARESRQHLAEFGPNELAVIQGGEGAQLSAAGLGRRGRHQRVAIPVEQLHRAADVGKCPCPDAKHLRF